MKNDDTKINIITTTLKGRMSHNQAEQETVFKLAATPRLRRPYGLYGIRRRKTKKTSNTQINPKLSPYQAQGQRYEQQAINFLKAQGMIFIAKNLCCKLGEIDCVMLDDQTLVFVEVRQRSQSFYGDAAASINKQKQHRIKQAANYFLPKLCRHLALKKMPCCRFDVLTFDGEDQSLQWLRHAFV